MIRFYVIALTLLSVQFVNAQVLINEILASNTSVITDPDFGDYADYIELVNTSGDSLEISGFTISDKEAVPGYKFPMGTKLPPNGYLLLWADDQDVSPGQEVEMTWKINPILASNHHLDFKLKQDGEGVFLFNASQELIDSLRFGSQAADVAFARNTIDLTWGLQNPSPQLANEEVGLSSLTPLTPPVLSQESGLQHGSFQLAISTAVGVEVRYTVNGEIPTRSDSLYSIPIEIDKSTTIRARGFKEGELTSEVITATYVFALHSLPQCHLTIRDADFFNTNYGIYTHSRKDAEVPVTIELFDETGKPEFQVSAGLKLFGSTIFQLAQKPFSISMKGKYGYEVLEYQLFDDKHINQFKSFVFRNGGNDFGQTMMRDGLLATLASQLDGIDYQGYKPTALYLNGTYWGLYNMREKMNEDYLSTNRLVSPDRLDVLEDSLIVNEGSSRRFEELLANLDTADLSVDESYEWLANEVDVDAFMNYMMIKSFVGYVSFTVNNKYWRSHDDGGKWRWLTFDLEHGFDCCGSHAVFQNTIDEYLNGSSNEFSLLIFRKLWQNEGFRTKFIQRYLIALQSKLSSETVLKTTDQLASTIQNEIPNHLQRWQPQRNVFDWQNEVNKIQVYAQQRPGNVKNHLLGLVDSPDLVALELDAVGSGDIAAQGIILDSTNWQLDVLSGVSLSLSAQPKAGYQFVRWSTGETTETIAVELSSDSLIYAVFELNSNSYRDTVNDLLVFDDTSKPYIIDRDLVISKNGELQVKSGVTILMAEATDLIIHGKLSMIGTKEAVITIEKQYSSKRWGNIVLDNAKDTVKFNYLEIIGAGFGRQFTRSAITSINSNLIINHVSIDASQQPVFTEGGSVEITNSFFHMDHVGDLINITKTNWALVEGNEFRGNREQDTDAIDFDEVDGGIIRGNWIYGFRGFNSDGIDLGEGCKNVRIEDNEIYYCSDKGVSVGQASEVLIKNNIVTLCSQGVGVKDEGAIATVDYNTFHANKIALAAFEKNPGAGGGMIMADHNLLTDSDDQATFVDDISQLILTNNSVNGKSYLNATAFDFSLVGVDSTIGASIGYKPERHVNRVLFNELYVGQGDSCMSDDWVELKNGSDAGVSLKDWVFSDGEEEAAFTDFNLEESGFAVMAKKPSDFQSVHSVSVDLNFDFGLRNSGERLYLFDNNGMIVNSVFYKKDTTWPKEIQVPIGLDVQENQNVLGDAWFAYNECLGTPGMSNDAAVGLADYDWKTSEISVYPNPTIGICALGEGVDYKVFNLLGELLIRGSGKYVDLASLDEGLYVIHTAKGSVRVLRK